MTETKSSESWAKTYYSEEEFQKAIAAFQIETTSNFVRQKKRRNGGIGIESLDNKKIWWEDKSGLVEINYNGEPYIVTGSEVYECHHGPIHGKKIRTSKGKDGDHNYGSTKSRKIIQDSKKLNCPAKIRVRRIIRFPAFKNHEPKTNRSARKRLSKKLKTAFADGDVEVIKETQIIATFPEKHDTHLQGELSGYSLPLNKEMGTFIKTMARKGVRSVTEMERHLDRYREEKLTRDVQKSNRSYFPPKKTIRNHIYRESIISRFSNNDQMNLRASIEKWQENDPNGNIFLRIASQEEDENPMPFLFIHQTTWQQNILKRFGSEVCLLDSTYNTSKFELPLYLLCVQTNVGFVVVASMLLGRDTRANLTEGLNIVRQWNSSWHPRNFMCDYDTREISALENVFNGCEVYLCDFHREQAWQRWVNDGKNSLLDKKMEVLQMFRSLANAESEESFQTALQELRESALYKENLHLRNYIEKKWIAQSKRWVKGFRSAGLSRVNTTNGLERQNRELKENFLKMDNPGKSLTEMVSTLVNSYLPKCRERFVEKNVKCMESHRAYNKDVPKFLRGRPKSFIVHCMERMNSIEDFVYQQVEEGEFTVKSRESDNMYTVILNGKMPNCNCPDFKKNVWPCKHMLTVLRESNYRWDMLNESFTNNIFNTVDMQFVNTMDSASAEVQTSHREESNDLGEDIFGDDSKISNECHDLIKQIKTDIYNIASSTGLNLLREILHEAYCLSQKYVANTTGLPLRRGRKNKGKTTVKKRKKNPVMKDLWAGNETRELRVEKEIKEPQNGVIHAFDADESTVDITCEEKSPSPKEPQNGVIHAFDADESTVDITCEEKSPIPKAPDGCQAAVSRPSDALFDSDYVVRKIWAVGSVGHLIAKIGPYLITDESIKSLQTTLTDEVMDGYISLLSSVSKHKKVFHMETAIAKSIFEDASSVHGCLRQVALSDYDVLLGAVNENNDHWTLCAVYPKLRKIVYVNPLGETQAKKDKFLMHWKRFLLQRYNKGLDSPPMAAKWRIETKSHIKQYDSVSCGVYVLKFAEHCVWDKPLKFRSAQRELTEIRLGIAKQLLEISEPLDNYCRKCCLTETTDTLWMQCDSCPNWFHSSCLDIPRDKNIRDIQSNPFLCSFCLKDYETESTVLERTHCRNTTKNRNTYQLRLNPQKKRKRSSFVYDTLKKTKVDSFKSTSGEDKEFEKGKSLQRLSPPLVRQTKRRQISDEMKAKTKLHVQDCAYRMRFTTLPLEQTPPLLEGLDIDDMECFEEKGDRIGSEEVEDANGLRSSSSSSIAQTALPEVYSTLKKIVSEEVQSPFHLAFLRGQRNYRHGYGMREMTFEVHHQLKVWLVKVFIKDSGKSIFTRWSTIRGASEKLLKLFEESPTDAEDYLEVVLFKEMVTRILMITKQITWANANTLCLLTETDGGLLQSLKLARRN